MLKDAFTGDQRAEENREITMPDSKKCSSCGGNLNRHGLARQLEWGGAGYSFCSDFCEFFRRRTRFTDDELSEAASPSVHEAEKPLLRARQSASQRGL
jgi:hypothetical protein